jgi:hypothetical protein
MEVPAVDERHLDRCTPQLRDRLEAAETSADDDDVVFPGPRRAHNAHYFRCIQLRRRARAVSVLRKLSSARRLPAEAA